MPTKNLKYTYPIGITLILMGYLVFSLRPHLFSILTFCPFKTATGFPCPACGSTRASFELYKGNIIGAILTNPLAIIVHLFFVLALFWMLRDLIKGKDTFLPNMKKDWNSKVKFVVFTIILANWVWNLFKGL